MFLYIFNKNNINYRKIFIAEMKIDNLNYTESCANAENKENSPIVNVSKNKQSHLSEVIDHETTVPDFGVNKSYKQSCVFSDSIMAQSNLMSYSRIFQDTLNTKQIGRLAFNEPTEPSNIFGII